MQKNSEKIPPTDNNVERRKPDISEDLCDQIINLKMSHSSQKADEATDVIKDAHLITVFGMCWKVLQRSIFCIPTDGRTKALECSI
jgi:hypothetical protein